MTSMAESIAGGFGVGEVDESSHAQTQQTIQKKLTGEWSKCFQTSKATPNDTRPSSSSQIVLPAGDQVFKKMHRWGHSHSNYYTDHENKHDYTTNFSFMCMCVYLCVYTYMFFCVFAHMCTCMWCAEVNAKCFLLFIYFINMSTL